MALPGYDGRASEPIYHPGGGYAALQNAIMRFITPDDYDNIEPLLYGGLGVGGNAPVTAPA
jgi:hypothetical protein